MNAIRALLRERFDAEIEKVKREAKERGGWRALLEYRMTQYSIRTQGLQPRVALVGEIFFHEFEMELKCSDLWEIPFYYMSSEERTRRMKECPVSVEGAVGAMCIRNLWVVGNYSQQDAIVFIP